MRCRCGKRAIFNSKVYRVSLCENCYSKFYVNLVKKSIKKYGILKKSEKILACISGGKDSVSMVYTLKELGYNLNLFFIDLGIKNQSVKGKKVFEESSEIFDLSSSLIKLKDFGLTVDDFRMKKICSACGTAKRYLMNKFASENGFDIISTGHTCDDILLFFFKNILSGNLKYITKLRPRVDGFNGLVTKVKPIFERIEEENLILVKTLNLPFLIERCPYKPRDIWRDLLQTIEKEKPGFKQNFVRGVVKLASNLDIERWDLKYCKLCGEVSSVDVCSFCRLVERYSRKNEKKFGCGSYTADIKDVKDVSSL